MQWNESGQAFTMLGHKLELMESPEPSDIIWENVHLDQSQIYKNWIKACALVIIFLLFLLAVFISAQGILKTVNGKYPPMLRCYPVTEVFGEEEDEGFYEAL